MVDAPHPLLIAHPVSVIGLLHLQLLGTVGRLYGITDVRRQIDAPEAGEDGGPADGIDNHRILRHEIDDRENRHEGRQHQDVHHHPHLGGQAGCDPAQILPEEMPCAKPEQQPQQHRRDMDGRAGKLLLFRPQSDFFAGSVRHPKEKPTPHIHHQVIHGNQRGVKDQHRCQPLCP